MPVKRQPIEVLPTKRDALTLIEDVQEYLALLEDEKRQENLKSNQADNLPQMLNQLQKDMQGINDLSDNEELSGSYLNIAGQMKSIQTLFSKVQHTYPMPFYNKSTKLLSRLNNRYSEPVIHFLGRHDIYGQGHLLSQRCYAIANLNNNEFPETLKALFEYHWVTRTEEALRLLKRWEHIQKAKEKISQFAESEQSKITQPDAGDQNEGGQTQSPSIRRYNGTPTKASIAALSDVVTEAEAEAEAEAKEGAEDNNLFRLILSAQAILELSKESTNQQGITTKKPLIYIVKTVWESFSTKQDYLDSMDELNVAIDAAKLLDEIEQWSIQDDRLERIMRGLQSNKYQQNESITPLQAAKEKPTFTQNYAKIEELVTKLKNAVSTFQEATDFQNQPWLQSPKADQRSIQTICTNLRNLYEETQKLLPNLPLNVAEKKSSSTEENATPHSITPVKLTKWQPVGQPCKNFVSKHPLAIFIITGCTLLFLGALATTLVPAISLTIMTASLIPLTLLPVAAASSTLAIAVINGLALTVSFLALVLVFKLLHGCWKGKGNEPKGEDPRRAGPNLDTLMAIGQHPAAKDRGCWSSLRSVLAGAFQSTSTPAKNTQASDGQWQSSTIRTM